MRICAWEATKGAPFYEQKELRSSGKRRRRAFANGAELCGSRDNAAFDKILEKSEKGKAKSGKLCYTELVCYQYEEEINDGKLF